MLFPESDDSRVHQAISAPLDCILPAVASAVLCSRSLSEVVLEASVRSEKYRAWQTSKDPVVDAAAAAVVD